MVSASLIGLRSATRLDIKFLDTHRRPEYQGAIYASWRRSRLAASPLTKGEQGCSVVDFLVDPVGVAPASAGTAGVDPALVGPASAVLGLVATVGVDTVDTVSVGPASES
jgi:hypothetical protein